MVNPSRLLPRYFFSKKFRKTKIKRVLFDVFCEAWNLWTQSTYIHSLRIYISSNYLAVLYLPERRRGEE